MQLRCLEDKKTGLKMSFYLRTCEDALHQSLLHLGTKSFCNCASNVWAIILWIRPIPTDHIQPIQSGTSVKAISQRPWAQIAGSSRPRVPENVRGTVESQLGCFRVRWLDYIILMKVHPNSLYYTACLLVKIPNITIPGFGYPNAE